MPPLLNDERRLLLELARQAVLEAVLHGSLLVVPPVSGELAKPSGVFVTLRRRRRLRGCIGQVEPVDPLAHAAVHCAMAAALDDPRFEAVRPAELPELDIEISRLSPMMPITLREIEIGRHGLLISCGWQRGLLLPQVAAQFGWTAERFLEETCVKGGFEPDAWKDPGSRVEAFTAEIFSEAELRAEAPADERRARAG